MSRKIGRLFPAALLSLCLVLPAWGAPRSEEASGTEKALTEASKEHVSGERISGVFSEGDVSEENISEENISEENMSGEDISEKGTSGEDISGKDISGEDISEEDISEEDVSEADLQEMAGDAETAASVRGHVFYKEGNIRASGAQVNARDKAGKIYSTLTDRYGYFALAVPAGEITVDAFCGNFSWQGSPIELKEGETFAYAAGIYLEGDDDAMTRADASNDREVIGFLGASAAEIEAAFPDMEYSRAEGNGRPYASDRTYIWFYFTTSSDAKVNQIVLGGLENGYSLNGIEGGGSREAAREKLENEGWKGTDQNGTWIYEKNGIEIVLYGPAGSDKLTSVTCAVQSNS